MSMKSRKMNNYSLMRVSGVFALTIALVISTFSIPFMPRTGAEPLDPPYVPSEPNPENGSMNVSIDTDLSWTGGDPDGNNVTYDVYFGTSSPPGLLVENLTESMYNLTTLNYSTLYYWKIIAIDDENETTEGPEWEFTTQNQPNHPPYLPSDESPENDSIGVSIENLVLSWEGGDPDENDTVTYDVYFGDTVSPVKVSANQTAVTYSVSETLENNTMYYWRIVSWDSHKVSTIGDLWHFTTKSEEPLTVIITKPLNHKLYFNDQEQSLNLSRNTIVYGPITITAEVIADNTVERVEFFVDNKSIGEDMDAPYTLVWQPFIQFNSALSLTRTITVVAYDSENNTASAMINITKWRFHILPFVIAGLALASRLILHTTVSGIFFNFQQSRISTSFYAIRARFKTVGLLKTQKGVINFKSCTGGRLIGPMSTTQFGLFRKFSIGSFTFIGNLHADKIRFGQALLTGFLQRRTGGSGGGLLNVLSILR